MHHPFAELIGLRTLEQRAGFSRLALTLADVHMNPHHVVHGAVVFALADTGMGAALYPTLDDGELCATIEIKISYFKPASAGELVCETTLANRGRRVASLESTVMVGDLAIAKATGSYSIFRPGR